MELPPANHFGFELNVLDGKHGMRIRLAKSLYICYCAIKGFGVVLMNQKFRLTLRKTIPILNYGTDLSRTVKPNSFVSINHFRYISVLVQLVHYNSTNHIIVCGKFDELVHIPTNHCVEKVVLVPIRMVVNIIASYWIKCLQYIIAVCDSIPMQYILQYDHYFQCKFLFTSEIFLVCFRIKNTELIRR